MSKLLYITTILAWCCSINFEPKAEISDRNLSLTNGNQKIWYLYATNTGATGSCAVASQISQDNTYTFFANGTFEFDHGTLTNDSSCQGQDCCEDLVNIAGTWKFINNEKGLRITAVQEKNNAEKILNTILFDGTIDQLDESVLKFSKTDHSTREQFTFEFRKK